MGQELELKHIHNMLNRIKLTYLHYQFTDSKLFTKITKKICEKPNGTVNFKSRSNKLQ